MGQGPKSMKTIEDFNNGPIHSFNFFNRTSLYLANSKTIIEEAAVEIALVIITIAAATFASQFVAAQIAAPILLAAKSYLVTRLSLPLFDRSFLIDIHRQLTNNQKDISKTILLGLLIQIVLTTRMFLLAYVIPLSAGSILSILIALREDKASPGRELGKIV